MSTKYIDRWNPDKKWFKVLARPDKILQASELHEIQSMLTHQVSGYSSYLYDFYSIIYGLKISLVEMSANYNIVRMSYGQVYIETPKGGIYIDIEGIDRMPIPNQGRVSIGVKIDFEDITNIPDPLFLFGQEGSDRLRLKYQITINEDSYPIAVLDCEGQGIQPHTYYYSNRSLNKLYSPGILGSPISNLISNRWYEENGNYISSGLETSVEVDEKRVTVNAGIAYIDGTRILLPYGANAKLPDLPSTPDTFFRYVILLTKTAQIEFIVDENPNEYMPSISRDTIDLLSLEVTNKKIVNSSFEREIAYIPSKRRALSNADLLSLYNDNYENEKKISQIALDTQALNLGTSKGLDLNGVLTDSMSDLSRSDIYNPSYNASFMPSIRAIRPGYIPSQKDASNLSINGLSTSISFKDASPYYAICEYSEKSLINQTRSTDWLSLNTVTRRSASMVITPNRAPSDASTIPYSSVAPSAIPTLSSNILKELSLEGVPNINLDLRLKARRVRLSVSGLNPNDDNLELLFGSNRISQFTLLNGTSQGTSSNSVKARSDGGVDLSFLIPSDLPLDTYIVSLSNTTVSALAAFHYTNDSDRLLISDTINPNIAPSFLSYSPILEGLAQTFLIEKACTITSVSLALRKVPPLRDGSLNIARLSLVRTENGIPNGDCIGVCNLNLDQVNTSPNGSKWSTSTFERPVIIPSSGIYALIVTPLVSGIEIYQSTIGKPSLVDGSISGDQSLLNGSIFLKEQGRWQVNLASDLTFSLKMAVMSNTKSEVVFEIENEDTFDSVYFNIPHFLPPGTGVEFYSQDASGWKLIKGSSYQLQSPSTSSRMKAVLFNNLDLSPILELDNMSITTYSNRRESTWVSITGHFDTAYNNVEISLEAYKPRGTDISIRFSSNGGLSWEVATLDEDETQLINGNIPLYSYTYKALNLSDSVSNQSSSGAPVLTLRKKLTIRIDFKTTNSSLVPFIRRMSSIAYAT